MADQSQPLPYRSVAFKFPKVRDFTDPDYDKHNPEHLVLAQDQRFRESFVNRAHMIELRENVRRCALRHSFNSRRECKDISDEYMRRLKCPGYVCPEDEGYLPPVFMPDYRLGEADDYLELNWKRNMVFDVDKQ